MKCVKPLAYQYWSVDLTSNPVYYKIEKNTVGLWEFVIGRFFCYVNRIYYVTLKLSREYTFVIPRFTVLVGWLHPADSRIQSLEWGYDNQR